MVSFQTIDTSDSHVTFMNSGWSAHDFKAWLRSESDEGGYSHDVLIEATFQLDDNGLDGETGRLSGLPSLDFQLDFNQSHITPIRLGLGAAGRASNEEIIPFRLELPLYDLESDLDADKMKLSVLSLGYSSGTYFERNGNYATFDERKTLPVETFDRVSKGRGFEVLSRTGCYWRPERYEDDVAEVRASIVGIVQFSPVPGVRAERKAVIGGGGVGPGESEANRVLGTARVERTLNVVLDLRGSDGIPLGSQTFRMFPSVVVDGNGRPLGEPFHFQIEHGFDIPLQMVGEALLTVSVYGK